MHFARLQSAVAYGPAFDSLTVNCSIQALSTPHGLLYVTRLWRTRCHALKANADSGSTAARTWLRQQQRAGNRAARPVLVLHVAGSILGVGQSIAAAALSGTVTAGLPSASRPSSTGGNRSATIRFTTCNCCQSFSPN
jgi:hypothetical protein